MAVPKLETGALFVIVVVSKDELPQLQVLLTNPGATELAWVIVVKDELSDGMISELELSGSVAVKFASVPREISKGTALLVSANTFWMVKNASLVPVADRDADLDASLATAAEQYGSSTLCVLLSALTGDGEEGLKTIKQSGGIILALDPGGPTRSRFSLSVVDRILPFDGLVNTVFQQVLDQLRSFDSWEYPELRPIDVTHILTKVQEKTGRDLGQYRPGIIVRCIERRMRIGRVRATASYLDLLDVDSTEAWKLYRDASIGVTRFFREAEVFDAIECKLLPELIRRKSHGAPIRVWVPACGTGEEAYSIVILLLEYLDRHKLNHEVRVFASDVDEELLRVARRGSYSRALETQVSKARLAQFFRLQDGQYQATKRVRDCVTLSAQDLLRDPPFSKLDLVFCRNVLVRFAPEVRSEMTSLFYFALEPLGYLVLGRADTSAYPEGFTQVEEAQPIFKRPKATLLKPVERPLLKGFRLKRPARAVGSREPRTSLRAQAERMLLREFVPTCIVFDDQFEILHCLGKSDDWLEIPSGIPTTNLFAMTRPELRSQIRGFVTVAVTQTDASVTTELTLSLDGRWQRLQLSFKPLPITGGIRSYALVLQSAPAAGGLPASDGIATGPSSVDGSLQVQLQQTRAELEGIVEQYESRNRTLESINEQLLDMNEELESSNQELRATREEQRSATQELERRVVELSRAREEVRHLFESADIPTVFLDTELRVRSFTPAARQFFALVPLDCGRVLFDIAARFQCEDLELRLREALRAETAYEGEVHSASGDWYTLRILPCRSEGGGVEGAVLNFLDVTRVKKAELEVQRLRRALEEQLGLALEREQQQTTVAELGVHALEAGDFAAFLERSLGVIASRVSADLGEVLELRNEPQRLRAAARFGFASNDGASDPELVDSNAIARLSQQTDAVIWSSDSMDTTLGPACWLEQGLACGVRLRIRAAGDGIYGVLGVYRREPRPFSKQDLVFLSAIADLLTSAIQRRRSTMHGFDGASVLESGQERGGGAPVEV